MGGEGTGTKATSPEVSGNYITNLDIDNFPADMSNADKKVLIDRIEQLVERITGDYFYAKSFDVKMNGNGKNRIFPSFRQDILSVANIYISEIEVSSTEWSYDEDSAFFSNAFETNGVFPVGKNNVRLKGTLGWSECPKNIKQACIILCRNSNDSTLYTTYYRGSEKLGDFGYSSDEKTLTGIREADILIRPYVRKKPMIGV